VGFAYFYSETGSIVTPTETVVNVPALKIDQHLTKLHSVITNKAPEDLEEQLSAYSKADINEMFHGMTAVMQASTRGMPRLWRTVPPYNMRQKRTIWKLQDCCWNMGPILVAMTIPD